MPRLRRRVSTRRRFRISWLPSEASSIYLVELIDTFLEEAPQLLAELHGYIEGGDAAGVRRIAHSLKSNGLDLGATTVCPRHARTSRRSRSRAALEGAADLYSQIASEYVRVEAALRRLRTAREIA